MPPRDAAAADVRLSAPGPVKISVPLALAQEALRSLPDVTQDQMRDQGVDIAQLLRAILHNPKPGKLVEVQDAHGQVEIALE